MNVSRTTSTVSVHGQSHAISMCALPTAFTVNCCIQSRSGCRARDGGGERAREGRLIAAVERGEIDSFHGGIELAFVIVLAVGECRRCLFGGDDVAAQFAGIGLAGIIDEELCAGEASVFGVVRSADGDVDLLARERRFR